MHYEIRDSSGTPLLLCTAACRHAVGRNPLSIVVPPGGREPTVLASGNAGGPIRKQFPLELEAKEARLF